MSLEEVTRETVAFVEFLFPGLLFPEEKTQPVECREMEVEVPEGAFAYSFFDCEKTTVGGKEFWGPRKNHSGRFYPGGEILTLEDVKALPGDYHILIWNMECNGWERVVRTRCGNVQPFTEEDRIVELSGDEHPSDCRGCPDCMGIKNAGPLE